MPANQYFLTLNDGRKLSYALYGPADGKPVFYFHGTPSSRLEPLLLNAYGMSLEQLLQQYSIRLIAVDRPGVGLSTYHENKSFQSFAGDVQQLAVYLNITNAAIMGWSGAGPYALALAFYYPHLITGIYLLTAFTRSFSEKGVFKALHTNKYYFASARYVAPLLKATMNIVCKRPTDTPVPKWLTGLPEVDYQYISTPDTIRHFCIVSICESCINGSRGAVQEAALYFNKTGYGIGQIQQPIHYWWGNEDRAIPIVHPKAIEETAPRATMHYKQGEGHLSIYVRYFEEVLQTIAGA